MKTGEPRNGGRGCTSDGADQRVRVLIRKFHGFFLVAIRTGCSRIARFFSDRSFIDQAVRIMGVSPGILHRSSRLSCIRVSTLPGCDDKLPNGHTRRAHLVVGTCMSQDRLCSPTHCLQDFFDVEVPDVLQHEKDFGAVNQ